MEPLDRSLILLFLTINLELKLQTKDFGESMFRIPLLTNKKKLIIRECIVAKDDIHYIPKFCGKLTVMFAVF